jgi:hypothetical protein
MVKFFKTKRNVILFAVIVTLVLAAVGVGLFFLLRKKVFSASDLIEIGISPKGKGLRMPNGKTSPTLIVRAMVGSEAAEFDLEAPENSVNLMEKINEIAARKPMGKNNRAALAAYVVMHATQGVRESGSVTESALRAALDRPAYSPKVKAALSGVKPVVRLNVL